MKFTALVPWTVISVMYRLMYVKIFLLVCSVFIVYHVMNNYIWVGYVSRDTYVPDDGRSISRNLAYLNILVHDEINLLYYRLTLERVVSWWLVSYKIFSLKEIFFTMTISLSSEEMYAQTNKIKPSQTTRF